MRNILAIVFGACLATSSFAQLSMPDSAKVCVIQFESKTDWVTPKYEVKYSCGGALPLKLKFKEKELIQIKSEVLQELITSGWKIDDCSNDLGRTAQTCTLSRG